MWSLWLRGKLFNYSIINAHARTEGKADSEKDVFYHENLKVYDSCSMHDVKIIIGDLKAQIDKEALYYPTIGKEAFHQESNANGKKVLHFAASTIMTIGSTLSQHKEIHKINWRSPNMQYFSQVGQP